MTDQNLSGCADTGSSSYGGLVLSGTLTLTFSGTLAPGKTLCIDAENATVENDGVNALNDFSMIFPKISRGTNTVVYTDSEGTRSVTITVTKQDRMV
jgi:hypothetical protein